MTNKQETSGDGEQLNAMLNKKNNKPTWISLKKIYNCLNVFSFNSCFNSSFEFFDDDHQRGKKREDLYNSREE